MLDEKKIITKTKEPLHNLIMENRSKLSVSGVLDVESFDENVIILHTELDMLTIKGFELHINKLNVDSGELIIEGEFESIVYSTDGGKKSKGSLFSRMFK